MTGCNVCCGIRFGGGIVRCSVTGCDVVMVDVICHGVADCE